MNPAGALLALAAVLLGGGGTSLSEAPLEGPAPTTRQATANLAPDDVLDYSNGKRTRCSPADLYPGHRVPPIFYQDLESRAYRRYVACVKAEARRDGTGLPRLASARSFPPVGTCYATRVVWIGGRMSEDNPADPSGSAIRFANRIYLVDYSVVPGVVKARVGDRVRVCVHDLPKDCPADDLRGIGYRVLDLRTRRRWVMGNWNHICRGA